MDQVHINDKSKNLKLAMEWLASQPDTVFIGQAISFPGTAMSDTFSNIPSRKKIEFPVAEEFQMGVSLGMAMNNLTPITIFPRINFLLCAINQLVNHIDTYSTMNNKRLDNNIIIRTAIGSDNPMNPGIQHLGDYTDALKSMLNEVKVKKINHSKDILDLYKTAYNNLIPTATIIIE